MKKIIEILALILVSLLIVACGSGTRINLSKDNLKSPDIPSHFKNRLYIEGLGSMASDIGHLVGHLVYLSENKKTRIIKRYIPKNYNPRITTISSEIYSSKISSGSIGGLEILLGNAKISDDKIYEVNIVDTVQAIIDDKDIPRETIINDSINVKDHEKQKIYYIKSVLITSIDIKQYNKIENESNIINGEIIGANGNTWVSNNIRTHDIKVSIDAIRLDDMILFSKLEDNIKKQGFWIDKLPKYNIIPKNKLAVIHYNPKSKQDWPDIINVKLINNDPLIKVLNNEPLIKDLISLTYNIDQNDMTAVLKQSNDKLEIYYERQWVPLNSKKHNQLLLSNWLNNDPIRLLDSIRKANNPKYITLSYSIVGDEELKEIGFQK